MTKKSNVLTIRVPTELKEKIQKAANDQGVSINQFALYAFTKGITELETIEYLKNYSNKSKSVVLKNFDKVFKNIKNRKVPNWDKT